MVDVARLLAIVAGYVIVYGLVVLIVLALLSLVLGPRWWRK